MSEGIPDGWTLRQVKDVATVFAGGTPSRDKPQYFEGENPWVKSGEVNRRRIRSTEEHISDEAIKDSSARWVEKGSVLIAMYGATAGKVAVLDIDATINQAISAVIGKKEVADNRFLLHALEQNAASLLNTVQGSGQPNLSGSLIKNSELLIPPISEQQKIASILTSVDEVIEKTEAQISKLQDLKKGMMQELLTKGIGHTEFKDSSVGRIPKGWTVRKVSDFLSQSKRKGKEGLPIYSVLMEGGMVDRTTVERRIASDLKPQDNLFVRKGDLVYNMMRMWQGASGIAPVDCMVSPAYVVCHPKDGVVPEFLGYLMKSPHSIQKLHQYSQGLTGDRLRLYFDSFARISFVLPKIEEQQKIAAVLSSIDRRLAVRKRQLESSQRLKFAMMQDLLTGKVRVKVN